METKLSILKEVISSQKNTIFYNSSNFTTKHKLLVYQAIDNLLTLEPKEMIGYLLDNSRTGGFQNKIFQEYISLLEKEMPFSIRKNNKIYQIDNLLSEHLSLFDGISIFEEIVNEKLEIKNSTKEYYIGGRKAFYTQPFYIGKLLEIRDKSKKISLLDKVVNYNFSLIKMRDIEPGIEVIVTHLRVFPHYQMGGMVYINRIRKSIVDEAKIILNNGK